MDGYRVQLAADGREALDALAHQPPDAIVLDVLMPEPDGLEVCRRLRAAGDRTPVLMLTARDAVPDRVKGLDAGADDYLVKPFALEELGARLRALLRRTGGPIDEHAALRRPRARPRRPHRRTATARPIELTRTEFLLLELLLRHPRQVLTRTQIFEHVWGYDFGPTLELARGLRRLPAPQARGGRRAAADPHGPRRRLRPARAVSFRRRLALSCGAAVAVVGRARLGARVLDRARHAARARSTTRCATRSRWPGSGTCRGGRAGPGPRDQLMLLTGEAPGRSRSVDPAARRRRPSGCRRRSTTTQELRAVATGERAPFFADRDDRRRARARATSPAGRTATGDLRRARSLTEVDRALGDAALGARAARAGRDRARGAALAAGDAHRRAPGRRAHRRPPSTSPPRATCRAGSRPTATTRSRAWRRSFNTMLEALERSQTRAAPARRRRLARAAHAAHLAAHEPRGAGPRRPARPRATASALRDDLVAQLEELTALVGDLVELARDEEPERAGGRGRAARPARRRRGRARAPARAGRDASRPQLEPALVAGRARAAGPRGREPARQRRQVEPAGRRGRRAAARRRADRARPRPGHPGRTTARTSSTASTAPTPPAAGRAPGSGWRSCARWPRATAGRSPRRPPTAAARCCACGCRSSQQIPRFG